VKERIAASCRHERAPSTRKMAILGLSNCNRSSQSILFKCIVYGDGRKTLWNILEYLFNYCNNCMKYESFHFRTYGR